MKVYTPPKAGYSFTMRKYNLHGIVLKSINYKDADKIYTILTDQMGRVSALAKGVRKISSRRAGNLDTLNLITAGISESKNGFMLIHEVKTINSFKEIKDSLELSQTGHYLAEFVYRTIQEGQGAGEVLKLMGYTLKQICEKSTDPKILVAFFEIRMMKLLGYEIQIDRELKARLSESSLELFQKLYRGDFHVNPKKESMEQLDAVIKSYLHRHLDSKFKSLEFKS